MCCLGLVGVWVSLVTNPSSARGLPGDCLGDIGRDQALKWLWLAFGPEEQSLIKFGIKPDRLQFGEMHPHASGVCVYAALSYHMGIWFGYFSSGTRH